jgi:glycerate dehydrogenase
VSFRTDKGEKYLKIVVLDRDTLGRDISLNPISSLGECVIYDNIEDEKISEALKDANVCVVNKKVLGEENLKDAEGLKLICLCATGFNNVDIDYCKRRNIKVRNIPDYCTQSVCQHTFALLFSLMESISYYDDFVKSGEYSRSGIANHLGRPFYETAGKTWGIIGMGAIGRAVAKAAESFGANVIYSSLSGKKRQENYKEVSLEELLKTSDIISIHSPLNEKTEKLINEKTLGMMKKTAVIVNVGRGGIVDSKALADAVDNGVISGAAIDVYPTEPPTLSDPLMKVRHPERFVFSPHIAWGAVEARERCVKKVSENIESYIRGEERNDVWK